MITLDFTDPLIRRVTTREKIETAQAWLADQGIEHDYMSMIVLSPAVEWIALFRFENLDDAIDFQIEVIEDE